MIKGACNNVRVWLDNVTKCQRATQIVINKLLQATLKLLEIVKEIKDEHLRPINSPEERSVKMGALTI